MTLGKVAHTTERAILVLSAHPSLVATVQAFIANVEEGIENGLAVEDYANGTALHWARELLVRFPANVQQAAAARRSAASRRLAVMASVRVAQRKKYGDGGQAEPVSDLLEALGDAPDDVLRVIVGFVGVEVEETQRGKKMRLERAERKIEERRRDEEELRGEIAEIETAAGSKRSREE